jgi:hypothetical protein
MVSAFQSREFGFGFVMSPEQLQEVNNARGGKKYKDKKWQSSDSAQHIRRTY